MPEDQQTYPDYLTTGDAVNLAQQVVDDVDAARNEIAGVADQVSALASEVEDSAAEVGSLAAPVTLASDQWQAIQEWQGATMTGCLVLSGLSALLAGLVLASIVTRHWKAG